MADRVERLTNLLALLLETSQPLSLTEIAAALDGMYPEGLTARRGAFERDKAALREIGVPIESEIVAGGEYAGQTRYWIDRQRYELHDLELLPDERRALQVAVAATRSGSGMAQEALWKLGAGMADQPGPVSATLPSSPALAELREAVAARAPVQFGYRGVPREVEPYGLLLREGFWYLVGFDKGRGERRTYRVDRIETSVETGDPAAFDRPEFDLRDAVPADPKLLPSSDDEADTAPVDAVVRVVPPRAAVVERALGEHRVVHRLPGGAIDVVVPYRNLEALRSWVLGLGESAEVLKPRQARDAVIAWLRQVAGRR